ncbi:IS66 family insertion sequence element accessory protein TnpB [Bacteroides caccae]|uniref:Uncharacterized protein n=1 Tax=Bacteroides caccae TaxID=47678 RepID=A0A414YFJ8_9BACE|nr:IS66 family insertion sequence element accessory protein TnpB [Bacteroides caccae]KAA5452615.1 IS66 family insertion sequence element accessory protein TnpB [Bacteroides caccae]KAA5461465.1 IS66 family insertion sequence element accessory protein TnpB [Bacteroides caccae]KAA5470572.1 IS66 family insertion sequence element accessory protein TnpB [Bacteroides caccae]RHH84937.1 IS66 family insertion sequence hypothetical protein [Bacteroides caccae]
MEALTYKTSHQWPLEDFESIYAHFKSSGLSVMDFCSIEFIRPKRFNEWRSKLLRKGGFIPVKVNCKEQVSSLPHKRKALCLYLRSVHRPRSLYEISYPNGITIRLNGSLSPEVL